MPKIVLDTNVLVAALISNGCPARILNELVLENRVSLCLSEVVWEEYVDVLNRDKFSRYPEFTTQAQIV